MIKVAYGEIPKENLYNYFQSLIGKTYKIIPMKEQNCKTLKPYLKNYQRELIGHQYIFTVLVDEPMFISILNSIQYLISESYSADTCAKEAFKCIRLIKKISEKYFQTEV